MTNLISHLLHIQILIVSCPEWVGLQSARQTYTADQARMVFSGSLFLVHGLT